MLLSHKEAVKFFLSPIHQDLNNQIILTTYLLLQLTLSTNKTNLNHSPRLGYNYKQLGGQVGHVWDSDRRRMSLVPII